MKRLLPFAIIMLAMTHLMGQNIALRMDKGAVTGFAEDREIITSATLENTSSKSITVRWERVDESYDDGWTGSAVCDITNCHETDVYSRSFVLEAYETAQLNVRFYPNGRAGEAMVRLIAYVDGDSANTVISGTYSASAQRSVGVLNTKFDPEDIKVYPNPAPDYVMVSNLPPNDFSSVEVYNMLGKKMLSYTVTPQQAANGVQRFDLSTLSKGIYMIRVFDSQMNVIHAKTISKSKV